MTSTPKTTSTTTPTKADRCGKCPNCTYVERAKAWAMPNPPFSHATDDTVAGWNEVLRNYPCLRWDQVVHRILAKLRWDDPDGCPGPAYALITLTPGLCREIVDRINRLKMAKAVEPDLYEVWYWFRDGQATFLRWHDRLDQLCRVDSTGDEDEDGDTTPWRSVSEDDLATVPRLEALVERVECTQMCVHDGESVKIVTIPKHTSIYVETALFEAALFKDILKEADPCPG